MQTILPAIIAAIATIIAAWISKPRADLQKAKVSTSELSNSGSMAIRTNGATRKPLSVSLILGGIGLFAWIFPIVGIPLALIGLGFGVSHVSGNRPYRYPLLGLWLNVVSLMAAVANSAIGAYKGYYGLF